MISLRNLHLSRPMLEILRLDEVDISLRIDGSDGAAHLTSGSSRKQVYSAAANDFMDVYTRITNHTGASSCVSASIVIYSRRY